MSSAPLTSYKSATKERLLLDQHGGNGSLARRLTIDFQLEPDECFRVSASDLSAFYECWEVSPLPSAFTEMRREPPSVTCWRPPPSISGKEL